MKVYIKTFGCQMNEYDSERMSAVLYAAGHEIVYEEREADAVIINTCSVRKHAEDRAFSYIGTVDRNKRIIITGCMAQSMRKKIFSSFPYIHAVAGTAYFNSIAEILNGKSGAVYADINKKNVENLSTVLETKKVDGYLAVMTGCDNFCSYCIVPYTRGREKSRKPSEIIDELVKMVKAGYKEITLLGQNVNSYKDSETGKSFPELLNDCAKVQGVLKLRFMTSHPKDISEELVKAMAANRNICRHIHLPVQSGSDKILYAMNRKYTAKIYIDKIKMIRSIIPECAITTDILLGFPGETEEDFMETVNLIKEVRFDASYIFKYSPRTGTEAAKLADTVPEYVKAYRNKYVLELQKQISEDINKLMLDKVEEALALRVSTKRKDEIECRLDSGKKVFVKAGREKIGSLLKVKLISLRGMHFEGDVVE